VFELEPWSGTTTATVPLKMFAVPTALQDQSLTVDAAAMLPTLLLQALGKSSFERDSRMPAQIDAKIVIIGSGPAGYTAAIYAARAMLEPVLIQGIQPGGQLTITTDVENYPGFADVIQGPWLMEQMEKQAAHVGTKIVTDLVIKLELAQRPFRLTCDSGDVYLAETVILATGAQARWLGMPSEEKFKGFGVSACATCDGFFYRGKEVMVVGGGNTAVEEALFLTNFASQVTIVHRRDHFRAERILQERLFKHPKIKVVWDSAIDEICGTENPGKVTHVRLKNVKSGGLTELPAHGVFIAIGHAPATELIRGQIKLKPSGYVEVAPNSTATSVPGVFAAGTSPTRPIARPSRPRASAAWPRSRPNVSWHRMRAIARRQSILISPSLHHVSHHLRTSPNDIHASQSALRP
jgi:thioredoxin reductase (NADPH)